MRLTRPRPPTPSTGEAPKRIPEPHANPNLLRDRLANERTFLAWLRTGIAITSLGFVVARFDIFLQQLVELNPQPTSAGEAATQSDAAIPIGVILVIAGPVIVVMAAIRYLHTERALLRGVPDSRRLVRNIVIAITGGAVVAGVGLAIHIFATWPT